jgi:hypothetical protein
MGISRGCWQSFPTSVWVEFERELPSGAEALLVCNAYHITAETSPFEDLPHPVKIYLTLYSFPPMRNEGLPSRG